MTASDPSPAVSAMEDICVNLEEFFDGKQSPERVLAAVCQISGRYRMATCGDDKEGRG